MESLRSSLCEIGSKSNEGQLGKLQIKLRKKSWHLLIRLLLCSVALTSFAIFIYVVLFGVQLKTRSNESGLMSKISFPGCGTRSQTDCQGNCQSRSRRLVGGTTSDDHAWPWMAEILVDDKHFCGGVLITPDAVITAAHCVHKYKDGNIGSIKVKLGHVSRHAPSASVTSYSVSRVLIHNEFDSDALRHDVALLKLPTKVHLSNRVWPVCLPTTNTPHLNQSTITKVAGWGRAHEDGDFAPQLQEISLPLVSVETCELYNNELFPSVKVSRETNLCAGYGGIRPEYGCKGDSGGPLLIETEDKTWVALGVMSWGDPTCVASNKNSYTVFTKLDYYEQWIAEQLGKS